MIQVIDRHKYRYYDPGEDINTDIMIQVINRHKYRYYDPGDI